MTNVKICGLRSRPDVEVTVAAGAEYAGFVFAESPRRVAPGEVRSLVAGLEITPVGVFVDRSADDVLRAAEEAGLEVVQLHGSESPETCRTLRDAGLAVWKAVRPRSRRGLTREARRYAEVDALLVEGHSPEAAGGTGTRFPHEWLAGRLPDSSSAPSPEPAPGGPALVLAGGLTPETVEEAVRTVRPRIADVSSGVERAPGEKDPEYIRAFVRAVRSAAVAREGASGPTGG